MKYGFLLLMLLAFSQSLFAETVTADIFQQKTGFTKKLFYLDLASQEVDGQTRVLAVYKDLQGEVALTETGVFKKDLLISFEVDQKQTQEKGRIEVQGEKVLFTYEKDGKTKTAQEKLRQPLLTTANFSAFVKDHWREVTTESGVDVRFAVWFRLETVGFKIFKVKEVQKLGQTWVQLRMKPSSFVIAALVDPLDLWYSADSKQLMEMSGRVSPKLKTGSAFKDLDSDVRYKY